MTAAWRRLKPTALALIVPLLLLAFWQVATANQWTRLIPTPYQVAEYMVDFAWGGIYDDAYSATLLTHLRTDDLPEGRRPRVGDACRVELTRVGDWVLPFFRLEA